MKTEKLPSEKTITTAPFPASNKIYIDGKIHPQIKVAMREIEVANGVASKNSKNVKKRKTYCLRYQRTIYRPCYLY
jgi:hypothetical protein